MEEIKTLFKEYGWAVNPHKRNVDKIYIYGARRKKGKMEQFYLAPQSKIESLDRDKVVTKLELFRVADIIEDQETRKIQLEAERLRLEAELAEAERIIEEQKERKLQLEAAK